MRQNIKYYNHAYDIAFSLVAPCATGEQVGAGQLREALYQRLIRLTDLELMEACGLPFDSYETEQLEND